MLLDPRSALAQFSPGELSKAHHALEGSQNCVKCHDVGKEISGVKCFACHEEIKQLIDSRKGYHASVSSERCVTCHKEHLGLSAHITKFDKDNFEHAKTGFLLDGKHAAVSCDRCHNAKFIVNKEVIKSLDEHPRETYLGLETRCATCHDDVHKGKFQQDCAHCHTTATWGKVQNFDHDKARFPLEGKHAQVACAKCHPSMANRAPNGALDFRAQPFADCTPCHTSPHKAQLNAQRCASCHTAQNWSDAMSRPFDHTKTAYALKGRHAQTDCAKCHRLSEKRPFAQTFFLTFSRCTDCHADKHNGEFVKRYKNDCALCHTVEGYKPSTFTISRHDDSRFHLKGAHAAIICADCHVKYETAPVYHFASLRCETCHKDFHKGQFNDKMKESSCDACHTTERWQNARFDHSTTTFPLTGRHVNVACIDCHKEESAARKSLQYKKIPTDCQSCHKDIHRAQFATGGQTQCQTCHASAGWRQLAFDHETQSTFKLTGAHKNVQCQACHRQESADTTTFTRFKPMSGECVSCHVKGGGQ